MPRQSLLRLLIFTSFACAHADPAKPLPTKVNPQGGETYIFIPAGTFQMGCSSGDMACRHDHGIVTKRDDPESPAHAVTITKPFWLGRTPVTVAAYQRFAAATGHPMPPSDATNPAPATTPWST